jgi:transposase-like protein
MAAVIRLAVTMCIRYPPSLRLVEALLIGRGIDVRHKRGCQDR